jgi:hypothetical protein
MASAGAAKPIREDDVAFSESTGITASARWNERKQVAVLSAMPKMKFSRLFSVAIQRSLPPPYKSHLAGFPRSRKSMLHGLLVESVRAGRAA